jgi:transforming growth factor-beta-induced protein
MNLLLTTALLAGISTSALADDACSADSKPAGKDIVQTAVEAGSFKTLAAALGAADLVGALQGEGPFTVFAPTDEAFAKLPAGTVETLLKPENKAKLAAILTYHVVAGEIPATTVLKGAPLTTLNGQRIDVSIETRTGVARVDQAAIVSTDIRTSNGIIHVIDEVILPTDANLVTTAVEAGSFNTLVAAAKAAGLVDALTGDGPLTVFAPTDEAFAKLPAGTVETLLKPENKEQLASILLFHVVAGRVYSDQAAGLPSAPSLEGSSLRFAFRGEGLMVQGANIVAADVEASNGVIHVIDQVMLPPKREASAHR